MVDEAFLLEQEVVPWMEMPLWVPDADGYRGFFSFDLSKAVGAGLTYRSLATIVRDTLEWSRTRLAGTEQLAGMTREREAELVEKWKVKVG